MKRTMNMLFEALNEVYQRVQELTQVPSYQKNNEQD